MLERVGVEIGGTFTDLVWQQAGGSLRTHKVLSTPEAIHEAVLQAIEGSGADPAAVDHLVHGSTVATNALLTRVGARTALLTTKGFRDVIEIGTHDRSGSVYEIFYRKVPAPVPRRSIAEVDERLDADGAVVRPLDLQAARRTLSELLEAGADSFAICLLHAYANPEHERALAELVRELAPDATVSCSHEISPEFREYERTMTTVVNAFVSPVVTRYIGRLDSELRQRGYAGVLQIMQSNGGIMPAGAADRNAVRMLLSGPSAGVRGALWFARRNGLDDLLTLDMGGTSTDVALAPGLSPTLVPELTVDGLPIRTPTIDMVTVGAGGGSIAALDPGGFLSVGPASAGAHPGPACYGRGGSAATVTDAQVVAGLLRPDRFFGGRMALRRDLAEAALRETGVSGEPREIADAVLRMVNNNMAQAVRLVSTARGIDPTGFTLAAYGGGGPLHAAAVAEEIGMSSVLVPWSPGLTSAFGLLVADLTIDLVQTAIHPLSDATLDPARVASLAARCEEAAAEHGLDPGQHRVELGVDLRYAGQAFEITVWGDTGARSGDELRAAFEALHRQRYGYAREQLAVEAVNYRARLVEPVAGGVATPAPPASAEGIEPQQGEIFLDGAAHAASFLARETLPAGFVQQGPAIIEESTSTTVVPPGWTARVLESGDLLLERREQ